MRAVCLSILLAMVAGHVAHAAECENLTGQRFGDATVNAAQSIMPPFTVQAADPPHPVAVSEPFCRVRGSIAPTSASHIQFELWLPPAPAWNGKLEGVGNGGFAGSINYSSMQSALQHGYAVIATDTGHQAGSVDAGWAADHAEAIVDFAWRGIHLSALAAKAIVANTYSHPPAHSYFNGCSDGGREALIEAQRFPTDFDGIVAGAPANLWTSLLSLSIWGNQSLEATPQSALPPSALHTITTAVLAHCHGTGGVLDDPQLCHFDPATLHCRGAARDGCLTSPQITALRRIYDGPHDKSGRLVFPGFSPGGEDDPGSWRVWITGGKGDGQGSVGALFGAGFFGDMVFPHSGWTAREADLDADLAAAHAEYGSMLDASSTNLAAFKADGGKLIEYHGWNDAAIPPMASVRYYRSVVRQMGGLSQVRSFWRLFMAPGMDHCGLGAGPSAIGGNFGLPAPSHDPRHDVVAALDQWVTHGVAPTQIVASRYQGDDPSKPVVSQRPWCAWPAQARFSGKASHDEAASFTCVTPH